MKKLLAILLAVCMIMGLALTASAAETWTVDCPAWWGGHSEPVVLTETVQSWTFTCTTYEDAVDNWCTGTVVVWRSDDKVMNGTGNYSEELIVRSDCYAVSKANTWGTAGEDAFGGKVYPADWAEWLNANKAGAECVVTAQIANGNIVVGLTNNGITNVYVVPVDSASTSPVYLSMTGEKCTLTGWAETENHIDISAACESVGGTMNLPVVEPEVPSTPAEPAEDVVTELYGSTTAASGWVQVDVNTTLWGGTLDASCFVEGGYLSINFTTDDISQLWQVRLCLNAPWTELDWHVDPSTVANPVGVLNDLGNGNYSVTFSYDDIVAIYGSSDFAANLGSMSFVTNSAAPVAITNVTYTVPAPEPDNTNPKDGDSIAVVFALLAVSAAGIAVVSKKKEF